MSDDWESHRVTTAGGQFRALVYRRSSGNLSVRFPLGDYAARVIDFTPSEFKKFLKKKGWRLEKVRHFT